MSWGGYFFFYDCLKCGKKYRWQMEDMNELTFGQCPVCHAEGKLVGETKDVKQGDTIFNGYEDV